MISILNSLQRNAGNCRTRGRTEQNDVINPVTKLSHNDIRCNVKYAVRDSRLLPLNHLLFIFYHKHKNMGNCLPKLKKKNKVSFAIKAETETERTVSEI